MICGDFIARGRAWGNDNDTEVITNSQGDAPEEHLITSSLVCMKDSHATRIAKQKAHTDGVIDLALASVEMTSTVEFKVLSLHGSNHLPCSILIQ